MQEAIFSLIGVIVGSIITFFGTCILDWKVKRYEEKKEEKKSICNIIKQYEILQDKIWFDSGGMERLNGISQKEFMESRRKNREKELMYVNKSIMEKVDELDSSIILFDEEYDESEIRKIFDTISDCIEELRNYID